MTSSQHQNSSSAGSASAAEQQAPATVADGVKPQITPKQAQRINAPVRNMIISMVVLVACIVPVLWLMPQPNKDPYQAEVDLPKVAYEAGEASSFAVAAPELKGWHYNFARWNSNQADKINYWETGQITGSDHFITLKQADASKTNDSWIAQQTNNAAPHAGESVSGINWDVRTGQNDKDETVTYYIGEVSGTTVIMYGSDVPGTDFAQLADAVVNYQKQPTATASPTSTSDTGIH
ncbi:DUF4245 domain-containing protein [Rothia terrae]|uniref:DUF4245 domain-containing protein n=1 Tax=Rothia terrae TaxID=396015 RepID=UPI00382DD6F1